MSACLTAFLTLVLAFNIDTGSCRNGDDASVAGIEVAETPVQCQGRCDSAYARCDGKPGGQKTCAADRRACYDKCKPPKKT